MAALGGEHMVQARKDKRTSLRQAGNKSFFHSGMQTLLAYLVLAGVILACMLYLYKVGRHFTDSDMASEMILANLLNKSGGFFSHEWIYGNELRVLSTTQLYRIGLLIFPNNWLYARMVGQLLAMLLLAGGMIYCMRGLQFSHAASALGAAALCMPLTFWSINLISFGGYYACYLMAIEFSLGLIFRLVRRQSSRAGTVGNWCGLVILSLLCGMQGIRLMVCYACPIFLTAGVLWYLAARNRSSEPTKQDEYQYMRRLFFVAMVILTFACIGYLVNRYILAAQYSFKVYNSIKLTALSFQTMMDRLDDLFSMFGYQQTAFMVYSFAVSPEGVASLLGLFTGGAVFFFFFLCLRKWKTLAFWEKAAVAFFATSVLVCMVVYSITDMPINESYWEPVLPAALVTLFIGIRACNFKLPHARPVFCTVLAICMLGSSFGSLYSYVHVPLRASQYRVDLSDWLVNHGYRQGYATFWNSNVMTEISNGELEMWTAHGWNNEEISLASPLHEKRHIERYPSDEHIFFIMDQYEEPADSIYKYYTNVQKAYEYGNFTVYTCDNPHLLPE